MTKCGRFTKFAACKYAFKRQSIKKKFITYEAKRRRSNLQRREIEEKTNRIRSKREGDSRTRKISGSS